MGLIKPVGISEAMSQETQRRRVLFLFAHLHKGGMQRAVSNISLALPENITQHVGYFGTENPPFEYHATIHDFNVPGSLDIGPFMRFRNFILRLYRLRRFVGTQKIDVVVSFGEAANILNVLSFNHACCVLSIRSAIGGYGEINLYGRIYRGLIRWVYPFADSIVAVSEDLKTQIEMITGGRVPVRQIPNLYHLDRIKVYATESLPAELGYLNETPFMLNIGSLVREKGQDLLIAAFANISGNFPDLLLVLIGRGPEKERYLAEAKRLGIGNRVVIVEFDSNPYKYMRMAKVFVLPSLTEGFPNVLVEAMACSCPVVAFDCQTGPREILGDSKYGELVGDMTATALAERLNTLLSSSDRLTFLKEQADKRARHYDANCVIAQWIGVLEQQC